MSVNKCFVCRKWFTSGDVKVKIDEGKIAHSKCTGSTPAIVRSPETPIEKQSIAQPQHFNQADLNDIVNSLTLSEADSKLVSRRLKNGDSKGDILADLKKAKRPVLQRQISQRSQDAMSGKVAGGTGIGATMFTPEASASRRPLRRQLSEKSQTAMLGKVRAIAATVTTAISRESTKLLQESDVSSQSNSDEPCATTEMNTVASFVLPATSLGGGGQELLDNTGRGESTNLIAILDGDASNDIKVTAVAVPTGTGGATIKYEVKIDESRGEEATLNLSNYGPMHFWLAGPSGEILGVFETEVTPPDSILPPESYEFYDALTNRPVTDPVTVVTLDPEGQRSSTTCTRSRMELVTTPTNGCVSVNVSADGYQQYDIKVLNYNTKKHSVRSKRIFVSPVMTAGEVRAILHWGPKPRDLDLHLFSSSGEHVFFFSKESGEMALDIDVTSGFGPETVTFSPKPGVTYHAYVHHASTDEDECVLAKSCAKVVVQGVTGLSEITIPSGVSERYGASEGFWDVFSLRDGHVTVSNKIGNNWQTFAARAGTA